MSVIKEIAVYNEDSWIRNDIGAKAQNISLNSPILGASNLQSALNYLPASTGSNKILVTNSSGKVGYTDNILSGLSGNISNQLQVIQNKIAALQERNFVLDEAVNIDNLDGTGLYEKIVGWWMFDQTVEYSGTFPPVENQPGMIEIVKSGSSSYAMQTIKYLNSERTTWTRFKNNGVWQRWFQNISEVRTINPRTSPINFSVVPVNGYTTNSSKDLVFIFPGLFTSGSTFSFSSLSIMIRHVEGGYGWLRSGSDGGTYTQTGASSLSIWQNGHSVRSNEIAAIQTAYKSSIEALRVDIKCNYGVAKAENNTTIIKNNSPVSLLISGTLNIT